MNLAQSVHNNVQPLTIAIAVLLFIICSIVIPYHALHAGQNTSIDNAVQEIRNSTNGKIISADTVTIDNQAKHRIKVLMPNGHVKVFYKPVKQ